MNLKDRWLAILKKMPSLLFGLFLFGLGIALTVAADLGLSPWSVFHMGLSKHLPISFGQASQLTGLIILVLTCFIKVVPGLSSVLNMYCVGLVVDLVRNSGFLHTPQSFLGRFLMLMLGLVTISWASYFYLRVQLGAGPRDGLMEGLVRLFKRPVWQIRNAIEITVLIIGFLLGGPVGLGTIISAFSLGFLVQWAFRIGRYQSREAKHMNIIQMFYYLQGKDVADQVEVAS